MTEPTGGRGAAGRGRWTVVPEALRDNQRAVADACRAWGALADWSAAQRMADDELGLLGRVSGATAEYNRGVDTIGATYLEGARTLDDLAASLDRVATRFEEQDASYYRSFGYLERSLDEIPEPPS